MPNVRIQQQNIQRKKFAIILANQDLSNQKQTSFYKNTTEQFYSTANLHSIIRIRNFSILRHGPQIIEIGKFLHVRKEFNLGAQIRENPVLTNFVFVQHKKNICILSNFGTSQKFLLSIQKYQHQVTMQQAASKFSNITITVLKEKKRYKKQKYNKKITPQKFVFGVSFKIISMKLASVKVISMSIDKMSLVFLESHKTLYNKFLKNNHTNEFFHETNTKQTTFLLSSSSLSKNFFLHNNRFVLQS
eukprot:TRINITY_DN5989_c0_g2_i1.p1 TRINITY_DN5989_c0_g2~~TRINITY_DN5989_c0_g2_i1.p1  ORF type:complete len:246 (+),score=-8.99 TRINITY_DN5989_c0_g2_i1:506-1243(+)